MVNWKRIKDKIIRGIHKIWTGKYSSKYGVILGFSSTVLIGIFGYLLGRYIPYKTIFELVLDDFLQIWGLHAAIISIPIIGLSFAWNSVRNLPVSEEILKEYTARLRSAETVTLLLISNLIIGVIVFFYHSIPLTNIEMCFIILSLLIFSVILTIRRFQVVFDLLLNKTVDNKVKDFVKESISNKYLKSDVNIEPYIEHFVQKAHKKIQNENAELLKKNLKHIEDIIKSAISEDFFSTGNKRYGYILNRYLFLHKRCIKQKDFDSEAMIIFSIKRMFGIGSKRYEYDNECKYEHISLIIDRYPQLLGQHFSYSDEEDNLELLMDVYKGIQIWITYNFENSMDKKQIIELSKLIEVLLKSHSELWQKAIENECFELIEGLNALKKKLKYKLNPNTYEKIMKNVNRKKNSAENTSINNIKLKKTREVYPEIKKMTFYPYGWGLHLYNEGDVSEEFIVKLFNEYVKKNFKSTTNLTNIFFEISLTDLLYDFWESKSTERKLHGSYEPVSMKMAIQSWILDFYCTALCWIICKEEEIDELKKMSGLKISKVKENDYQRSLKDIKNIIEKIDSYRHSNYPLSEFIEKPPSIQERCDALIEYFEELQSALEKEYQKWIRKQPLSKEAIKQYEKKVVSALDSCSLREDLLRLSRKKFIKSYKKSKVLKSIFSRSIVPRKLFINDDKVIWSNFLDVKDAYQRYIIKQIPFEKKYVDSEEEAFSVLIDFLSDYPVETMIVNLNLKDYFQDCDDFEFDMDKNQYLFKNIRLSFEKTSVYYAVIIYEDSIEYLEGNKNGSFRVKVTPGEDVKDPKFNKELETSQVEDYVLCELSLKAKVQMKEKVGVIITRKIKDPD